MPELSLSERLRSEAQNNQMIDQHYLPTGVLMNEAADEIDRLNHQLMLARAALDGAYL